LHLLPSHGANLWAFLQKLLVFEVFFLKIAFATKLWTNLWTLLQKLLMFRNFFLCIFAFVGHGVDLWTFLQKLVVLHFCPRALLKSLLKNFYFVVLQKLVGLHFCVQALMKSLFMNFFLYSFAFVTKPLGRFVSILLEACCASLLFQSSLQIIL
jgi:hypothetical protein